MSPKILLSTKKIEVILNRLACQLIEKHRDLSNVVLVGLQPRGIFLLDRLVSLLETDYGIDRIVFGKQTSLFLETTLEGLIKHLLRVPPRWMSPSKTNQL